MTSKRALPFKARASNPPSRLEYRTVAYIDSGSTFRKRPLSSGFTDTVVTRNGVTQPSVARTKELKASPFRHAGNSGLDPKYQLLNPNAIKMGAINIPAIIAIVRVAISIGSGTLPL